jgi:hypothetical protein
MVHILRLSAVGRPATPTCGPVSPLQLDTSALNIWAKPGFITRGPRGACGPPMCFMLPVCIFVILCDEGMHANHNTKMTGAKAVVLKKTEFFVNLFKIVVLI